MLPQAIDFAAASRVSLGRLNLETRIPYAQAVQSGPASDPAGRFAKEFAGTLGDMLAPVCDDGDPSVWIIRRLDFELAGGRIWEPGRIAEALAGQMRAALLRVFSGEASDLAIRFPDRAAYLAQFLADLAEGAAWDRWYFAPFRHLRAVPTGVAACMALEAEPQHAFAALSAMATRSRLPRFLAGLSDREAERILYGLAGRGQTGADIQTMIAVCDHLETQPDTPALPQRPKLRLETLVGIGMATNFSPDRILAALDTIFDRLQTYRFDGAGLPPSQPSAVHARLSELGEDGVPGEQNLAMALRRLAARLDPAQKRAKPVRTAAEGIVTPRAGVFLLWRSVMDIGLDAALTAGCPDDEADLRRHRLAIALSGPCQADAGEDEALRWLTRHGASKASALSDEHTEPLQRALFETLTGLRPARALRLCVQQENGVTILQDAVTQDWYFASRNTASLRLPDADIASIVVPANMAGPLTGQWSGWLATPLTEPSHFLLTRNGKPDAAMLADAANAMDNLRPLGPDLAYLAGEEGLTDIGLTLMLFARAAYSDLGRRLPGLTLSSAAYLGRNAVHGIGRLCENALGGDADADVDLPSVPFDFIWRMTGLNGTVYRLADGRSIQLNMARASA